MQWSIGKYEMRIHEVISEVETIKPLSPAEYRAVAQQRDAEQRQRAQAAKQERDAAQQARQRAVWGKRAVLSSISQKAAGLHKRRKAARRASVAVR